MREKVAGRRGTHTHTHTHVHTHRHARTQGAEIVPGAAERIGSAERNDITNKIAAT